MSSKKSGYINVFESIFLRGIKLNKAGGLKKFWKLNRFLRHAVYSYIKRWILLKSKKLLVPIAIAFSPTMQCNLSCIGCYAADYPLDDELSLNEIDQLFSSAEKMGVFLFVITGGEPLMREGLLDLLTKHDRLLFLLITNGSLVDSNVASKIADSGNIIPVVSIDGTREQTDSRRGKGVYECVERAMRFMKDQDLVFGFSSTVWNSNYETLCSDHFIDEMINRGCSLGFYTEYVPIGSDARWDMLLSDAERDEFRQRVIEIRNNKSIMVAHLPDDEYGKDCKCRGIESGCVHINTQGYIEPCPFSHFSADNIKEKSLEEALRSRFLAEIRSSKAIYRHGRIGCALAENEELMKEIAEKTGAKNTNETSDMRLET
ncbi:MAG: radical SAM protein [Candidatus Poribacteria bacterium]